MAPTRSTSRVEDLSYRFTSLDASGAVLTRQQKLELRQRDGFCLECDGTPIKLYDIKKSALNPLYRGRDARDIPGECKDGVCFVCHPEMNPNRQRRHRRPNKRPTTANDTSGGPPPRSSSQQSESTLDDSMDSINHINEPILAECVSASAIPAVAEAPRTGSVAPRPPTDRRSFVPPNLYVPPKPPSNELSRSESGGSRTHGHESINGNASLGHIDNTQPSRGSVDHAESQNNTHTTPNTPPMPKLVAEVSTGSARPRHDGYADEKKAMMEQGMNDSEVDEIIRGVSELFEQMREIEPSVAVDIIISAMRQHRSQERVQSYCLQRIKELIKGNNSSKQLIMDSGAPDDISAAMKAFPKSSRLQEDACNVIWSLGVQEHNRFLLVRAGVCHCVVDAMKALKHDEPLVRTAIGALRSLSPEADARAACKTLGVSRLIAAAMKLHHLSLPVQRDGCAFLTNCATDIEKQFVVQAPLEELDAIVQSMRAFKYDLTILTSACFALKNYTWEPKNCRTLRQCPGVDEILGYVINYMEGLETSGDPSVLQSATNCLMDVRAIYERLDVSKAADESLVQQARSDLQDIVAAQGDSPHAVSTVLDFIETYEWSAQVLMTAVQNLRHLTCGSQSQQNRVRLEEAGVLKGVIRRVQRHERDAELMEESCRLLAGLAAASCGDGSDGTIEEMSLLIESGAASIVFRSLKCHMDLERVAQAAMFALDSLSSHPGCWREDDMFELGKNSRIQLVNDALNAHIKCEDIQNFAAPIISKYASFQ